MEGHTIDSTFDDIVEIYISEERITDLDEHAMKLIQTRSNHKMVALLDWTYAVIEYDKYQQ